MAPSPLGVIFWEKTMGYMGQNTLFCENKKKLVPFFKNWPPPLKNTRNATDY